jgi:predicted aspartyl protease
MPIAARDYFGMKIAVLHLALLIGIFGLGSAFAADAPPQCSLKLAAELPVDMSRGSLLVKLQVDGHDGMFLVDTGSPYSMLNRRMVDELGLKPQLIPPGVRLIDEAGKPMTHYVIAKKLMLNNMVAEDKKFVVMGESGGASAIDGIFGANFLAAYDLELDIPHGRIRLFSQDHCPGQVVYWTQDFASSPFTMDANLHVVMQANLDGHSLPTLLDTGASISTLSAAVARRDFDFDPATAGVEPEGHVITGSGASLPVYQHRFANLTLGGVEFRNTELGIIPDKISRVLRGHDRIDAIESEKQLETPMVMGMHHLAKIRAYIAYGERTIYISAADAK